MSIVFLSHGSVGDVLPHIALAKELQEQGYEVRLASHPEFQDLVESYSIPFFKLSLSFKDFHKSDSGQNLINEKGSVLKSFESVVHFGKFFKDRARQLRIESMEATEGANAIVCSSLSLGPHIAEKLGIPCFINSVFPSIPTENFPNPLLPMGLFGANFSYDIYEKVLWALLGTPINSFRKYIGLKPLKINVFKYLLEKETPYFLAFSRHLIKQTNFPKNVHVTGQWSLKSEGNFNPSQELSHFLESGPSPVYLGFGSMIKRDHEKIYGPIIEALTELKQRTILLQGWSQSKLHENKNVFVADYLPHDWLLKNVKACIHHGGSGTTHSVVTSGHPSLIIPFLADQFFWSKRISEMHLGPEGIPIQKISKKKLIGSIEDLILNPTYTQNAKFYSGRLKKENGVIHAAKVIESYL